VAALFAAALPGGTMRQLLFVAPLLLVGCTENSFSKTTEGMGDGGAAIEVSPPELEFGLLSQGEAEAGVFTIHSVGTGDLLVESVMIDGGVGAFTLVETEFGFMLPPGASQEVEVVFSPMAANRNSADAVVFSNDADLPEEAVTLLGYGAVPELSISPDPYDFGEAYAGCVHEGDLELSNVGTDHLEIQSLEQTGDAFFLTHDLALPLTLAPGESVLVGMDFEPSSDDSFEGNLAVTSNEPLVQRRAIQSGSGKYAGEMTDEWELVENPPSDIMFLVDRSCSMNDDASRLANNFSQFITNLNSFTTNWRVMVVTQDSGCNHSGILTSSSPNYAQRFTDAVNPWSSHNLFSPDSYTEALLTPAAAAVEQTDPGECNDGFMRPNAMLHIVMVSDEPEQSSSSWDTYVNQIIAKKGNPSLTRLSAIAGDYPNGCSSADAGSGYYEAVSYTGGAFLSICSTGWNGYMQALAEVSTSQGTFGLSGTAVEGTIVVKVNGNTVQSDRWTYEPGTNAVVFNWGIPEGGDSIEITYGAMANCD